MRHLGLITISAAILSFGLTLGAAPQEAWAGACSHISGVPNKKCVEKKDIAKNAIVSSRVKNESLRGVDILDGSISAADLGADSVDSSEIGANAVGASEIATGAVGTDEIADGSITQADLSFSSATGGDIGLLMTMIDNLALLQARGASAYVFVTSETYPGNLGGVAGADDKCQALADQAGLPGVFLAWIADSDSANEPATRFFQAPSAYILPPGPGPDALASVAADWTDLTDGSLAHPIDLDETGNLADPPFNAWTNVRTTGEIISSASSGSCNDWSTGSPGESGRVGVTQCIAPCWTDPNLVSVCEVSNHLYCFGN